MPVRYISPIHSEPKEFIEPVPDDYFIWWLYRNQCVGYSNKCTHRGDEINEIMPRSRSKKSILNWENRVLMCRECHNEYHRHGVNSKTQEELFFKRVEALKRLGREEYINYIPLDREFIEDVENKINDVIMKDEVSKLVSDFNIPNVIEFENGAKIIIK